MNQFFVRQSLFVFCLSALSLLQAPAASGQGPVISSFVPTSGPAGTLVTITGTDLSSPLNFAIGGVSAIAVSNDGTTMVGMVMPGASTGTISVTTSVGTANSSSVFTVIASKGVGVQQGTKLAGNDNSGAARQGYSTFLSADGNTAIVGGNADNNNTGAAWIYTRTASVWTQQGTKLTGTDNTGAVVAQGYSVSLSADGNTAIVGGTADNNNQGAAWIFIRSGSTWAQQGPKLVGTGNTGPAHQGTSVSISADGNTAMVGGEADNGSSGAGWIFTRSGTIWTQQGSKLVGTGNIGPAQQGTSVSLSADGNTAMMGGFLDNNVQGAVWIFTRSGSTWTQQGPKLVGTGDIGLGQQGYSISLSADGNTGLVGGYNDNNGQGAAWVFTRSGSTWTQQGTKLVGAGNTGAASQGRSVSLSADGNTAILGGSTDNSSQGAAWVFTRSGSNWIQRSKLVGTGSSGVPNQGQSVSLSADGNTALIGGCENNSSQGAAWVYVTSSDATLSAMTITSGTLSPVFAPATTSYTAMVPYAITAITLTPTASQGGAITINGNTCASGSASGAIELSVGVNTVSAAVTAQDGSVINTYTLVITRQGAPTITSFAPANGPAGTLVTITGTNLLATTAFSIGGVQAITISNDGSTLVGMVMPGAATGAISVITDGGIATGASNFIVISSKGLGTQQGNKLIGTGNISTAQQGFSVSLSADGNTAIVGGKADNSNQGAAWIYIRSGGIWTQQGGKLVGTGNTGASQQGISVSLSADGNTALVGGNADNTNRGAAWIYTRSGSTWTQQGTKLVGTGNVGASQQGISVSLSADGNTAMVGGYIDNNQIGAAWVYTRSGVTWTQQGTKLVGTGNVGAARQGVSVSLSADGNTAIVGGYADNTQQGAAWVYIRSGSTWTQQGAKLIGTGNTGAASQGISVSLSADGNTALVGGYTNNANQGAAWVYTRSGATWTQQGAKLVGTGNTGAASFGYSVSLSADGNTAVVGGYSNSSNVGGTWIYTRLGATWTQQGSRFVGTGSSNLPQQGWSVSLSADGNTSIVGGYTDNTGQGAAWIHVASSDARLSALTISSGTLSPAFSSGNTSYTTIVPNSVNNISLTPTVSQALATITVNGATVASGSASGANSLNVGSNSITTIVTSQDGSTRTYTIDITRQGPPTITSFTPTSGSVGTLVTVVGTNLFAPTGFSIGGVLALALSNDGITLVGMVMPGAITGAVSVVSVSGPVSGAANFTVIASKGIGAQQGTKLVGTGNVGVANQGQSVSVSADGNTAIVGGYTDNISQGAAWIYTRSGSTWTQQGTKLVGTGNVGPARQGVSVSLSADGNTALVGGYADNSQQGAAWVYIRSGSTWTQQGAKLVGTGNTGAAGQGYSVSLSADGNTALVGGYSNNNNQGAAWVYTRTGSIWTQQGTKLLGTGNVGAALQGISVSLSADGNTAIVGGNNDNTNKGAVWVFTRTGSTWTQQGAKLVGTGNVGTASEQGVSVTLSADGNTAMVGGYTDNISQGAAWIYIRSGTTWTQQGAKLVGSGSTTVANQGVSVSLSADGNTAIVGGYIDNNQIGAAWVYTRSGLTWTQQGTKLVGTGNIGQSRQGVSISMSADGKTAIVGGNLDNGNQGAAWVFITSSVATLSGLTVGSGAMTPTFASGITSYAACIENGISSITVSPTASGIGATIQVRVNGGAYTSVSSGNASPDIMLIEGTNAIEVLVTAQDGNTSQTYTIIVNTVSVAPAILNASQNLVCPGANVLLSQTAGILGTGANWQWYSDASFTQPVGGQLFSANGQLTVSPLVTTTYYLQAENGTAPCSSTVGSATVSVTVNVYPPTVAGTVTGEAPVCAGSSPGNLTLNGNVGAIIKWQSAGDLSFTQNVIDYFVTTNTIQGSVIGALNATIYVRALVNSGGCNQQASTPVLITVNQPSSSVSNVTLCSDAMPYTWNSTNYASAGSYTIHLTNQYGCDSSATLNLTVNQCIQAAVSYSGSPYCSSTGTVTPVFTAVGAGIFSSQPAGLSINTSTGLIDLAASQLGSYIITYGAGSNTATARVDVRPAQAVFLIPNPVLCAGALTPAINFATLPGTTVAWSNSNTTIGLAASGSGNIASFVAQNTSAITATASVTALATGGTGCSFKSMVFRITVKPVPVLTSVGSQSVCAGVSTQAISFVSTVPGTTILWTNNNSAVGLIASGTGDIASYLAANNTGTTQTASITATPVVAGCGGAPVSFTISTSPSVQSIFYAGSPFCQAGTGSPTRSGSAGGIYSAVPGGLILNATTGVVNLALSAPGIYTVTYSAAASGGCSASASAPLIIKAQATVNPVPNHTWCNGIVTSPIAFTGTAASYSWTNDNLSIGLAASGSGSQLPSFTTINAGPASQYANIRVTPVGNGSSTCTSKAMSFKMTINYCGPIALHGDVSGDGSTARITTTMTASPNPSSGRINIQISGAESGNWQLQLLNKFGLPVGLSARMNGMQGTLDMGMLTPGVYILQAVNTRTGLSLQKQVIRF
jgi:hypothetical protein